MNALPMKHKSLIIFRGNIKGPFKLPAFSAI
jgi:hypothetical protein